jgi:5-methylcytosine-specific restriction protein A
MPMCCQVMAEAARATDTVLHRPPKGQGASLEIEYRLPR